MPERNNIQTYERVLDGQIIHQIGKFATFLNDVQLLETPALEFIKTLSFNKESNGYIYVNEFSEIHNHSKFSKIKLRPSVTIYSKEIDNTYKDNWISFELTLNTLSIRDKNSKFYYEHAQKLVQELTNEMYRTLNQTGIFFTSESDDGLSFDALRTKTESNLWSFDYAVIPYTLSHLFTSISKTHKSIKQPNNLILWSKESWNDLN